jgi:hypothetical protein
MDDPSFFLTYALLFGFLFLASISLTSLLLMPSLPFISDSMYVFRLFKIGMTYTATAIAGYFMFTLVYMIEYRPNSIDEFRNYWSMIKESLSLRTLVLVNALFISTMLFISQIVTENPFESFN